MLLLLKPIRPVTESFFCASEPGDVELACDSDGGNAELSRQLSIELSRCGRPGRGETILLSAQWDGGTIKQRSISRFQFQRRAARES